jgi:Protein of unknown function (DUF3455)
MSPREHPHPRKTRLRRLAAWAWGVSMPLANAWAGASLSALEPPPRHLEALSLFAQGVQLYACRATEGAANPSWQFLAPQAELFDARGRRVGRHGAGPHWELFDGSRLVGRVEGRADAPVAEAIPWLLIATHSAGRDGALSRVRYIQRVHTQGGLAPSVACTARRSGEVAQVAYRAEYRLFLPQ